MAKARKRIFDFSSRLARSAVRGGARLTSSLVKTVPRKATEVVRALPDSALARRLRLQIPKPDPSPPGGIFYVAHLAIELIKRVESRSLFVLPGGVAFFMLLALFPAVAAVSSIYGLVANPEELVALTEKTSVYLPQPLAHFINDGLIRHSQAEAKVLGLSALVSIVVALMSANWGTKALCEALNIVFDRREVRTYVEFTVITLIITTTAVITLTAFFWFTFRVFGSSPALPGIMPTSATGSPLQLLEGVVLWFLLSILSGTIYRYGPAPDPQSKPISLLTLGSMFSGASIILVSWLLAQQFTSSDTLVKNFGALSSVAAVVIWAWIIVVVVLIGAEIVAIRRAESSARHRKRRRFFVF